MAYNVTENYKQVIYSGDARNKLKLLFNNVELQDADRYCEKLTVKSRIIPNGAKIFNLNNFISKEADLILHDIDTSIIKDQVSISIGTLVGNSYEYVPIGIFNIQDTPTNDKRKTTIKLRDNSVKFDFNYNAKPLIDANGGTATKLQILQDICSQASVTCNITSFIGYLDEIGVYDNTITAREYISRLAEQAGRIATINRSGELIFVDLNNLTTWEIPIEIVEKYENGTKFKIGRVVYEDGIVRYETPTSTDDTLFLDGSNNYINGELVKEQASSSDNSYYLENTGEADLAYFELKGKTTQRKTILPSEYTQVGYIESTGTQYIDLNYIFNEGDIIELEFMPLEANVDKAIFGAYERAGKICELGFINNLLRGNIDTTDSPSYSTNTRYKVKNTNGRWKYNDNGFGTTMPTTMSINCYLFARNYNGVSKSSKNKVYYLKITRNNVVIHNYIPCYRNNDNEVGMYDIVGNTFYTNEGTGNFIYGGTSIIPSPEFPSELVSVGYENLFDINTSYLASSVANFNIDGDTITFTVVQATTSGAIFYRTRIDDTLLENGKAYTLSCVNGAGANGTLYLQLRNRDGSYAQKSGAKTVVYDSNYGLFVIGNIFSNTGSTQLSVGDTATVSKIQVEKGNETHSYIPYGKYGIEVKATGKNLLEPETFKMGYYLDANYNEVSAGQNAVSQFIRVESNTTYSITGSYYSAGICFYDENKIGINRIGAISGNTVNTTNNTRYVRLWIRASNTTNVTLELLKSVKPQLEKGSATEYEAYKSNTQLYVLNEPLRSIGDIKDLLYIKNGMLYVDRKIGSVILNGSENWDKSTDDRGYPRYFTIIPNAYFHDDSSRHSDKIKSNYFIATITASPQSIYQYRDQMLFDTPTTLNTLQLFKTWLSTHNTEVQYVLAEPYTEEIGQVDMPSTYEGITYLDIFSNINTNTYLQYKEDKTQVEAILNEVDEFDIDSLKTGKILGNPAIDSYDLIQITDGNKIFKTLATNDLVYTGVLINTFDTQIGEEAKEQNVFINGEETFKKWARTSIDNVEGSISLQAGKIDEANDRINTTNLTIDSQGALLNVLANNSNIDVQYDSAGNPLSGEVREVTTTTGFKFNAEGMTIEDTSSNFKALHRNTGVTYYDGTTIVGQYTKDGSKQKDLELFGVYYYGKNDLPDTPMFVAQLYTDKNGEECFGHFYNRGDN